MHYDVLILGAGPAGICAARECAREGLDFLVLERELELGGLAGSRVDDKGFTWDIAGGHVVFSHYGEFDALIEECLGDDIYWHDRSSYMLVNDSDTATWLPYPAQTNVGLLDDREVARHCIEDLLEAPGGRASDTFDVWSERTLGQTICDLFFHDYNYKVWATFPRFMGSTWIHERVAIPSKEELMHVYDTQEPLTRWGPNNRFAFPRNGGTGEIWRRAAEPIRNKIRFGEHVEHVNAQGRWVELQNGERIRYERLISTIPLDRLVWRLENADSKMIHAAGRLRSSSIYLVGIGVSEPALVDWSWAYVATDHAPFYRVTNFAKYSPSNVPSGDPSCESAWMCEVSFSDQKPVNRQRLVGSVITGLKQLGLVSDDPRVDSAFVNTVAQAYPVPTADRDEMLQRVLPRLEGLGILSRGRFGCWLYENGNQDHACTYGIDAARRLAHPSYEERQVPEAFRGDLG